MAPTEPFLWRFREPIEPYQRPWLDQPTEIPRCGPEPRFKEGDRVVVARVYGPNTGAELIGLVGVVEDVESLPDMPQVPPSQHNYDVRTESGTLHYVNEQMLELEPSAEGGAS